MDRLPLPAPFPVGTKLRYVGSDKSYSIASDGAYVPIKEPGLEVIIVETRPGRRGTLRQCYDAGEPMEWEDTGEPVLDTTRDGYSVYQITVDGRTLGRMIRHEWVQEWEVVP